MAEIVNKPGQAQEKAPNPAKDAKKLFESHYLVAKQKLGRDPSFEDVLACMNEKTKVPSELPQAQAMPIPVAGQNEPEGSPNRPKILDFKAYYGMSDGEDGQRNPDPKKILFYEDPTTNHVYDCSINDWAPTRPGVLDHLPHRPIEFDDHDIVAAIAHGVLDDDDFSALDKSGLISDIPRTLWTKSKELQKNLDDLENLDKTEELKKSESGLEDDDDEEETDNVKEIKNQAGVDPESQLGELAEVHGEDLVSQIMSISLQLALTGMDEQIRAIVRDEMGRGSQQESSGPDERETLDFDDETE